MISSGFLESGIRFSFHDEDFVRIENTALGKGVVPKLCEAIVNFKGKVWFLEAKSSFPRMSKGNDENLQENVRSILEKFLNSVKLYLGNLCERPYKNRLALPKKLTLGSIKEKDFMCVLFLKDIPSEALHQIRDLLLTKMPSLESRLLTISNLLVLNVEMAVKKGWPVRVE